MTDKKPYQDLAQFKGKVVKNVKYSQSVWNGTCQISITFEDESCIYCWTESAQGVSYIDKAKDE